MSEGVNKGRLSLQEFVALTSTNAAKLYGLHPRKGDMTEGSDADFILWDMNKEVTISQELPHDAMDYPPYQDFNVKGWPIMTYLREKKICDSGNFLGRAGYGQSLECGRPPALDLPTNLPTHVDPAEGRFRA